MYCFNGPEPLTAFLISVVVLHESVRGGPLGYLVVVGSLVAITTGIFVGLGSRRTDRATSAPVPTRDVEAVPMALAGRS